MQDYTLFHPTYTKVIDGLKVHRTTSTHHIRFTDHRGRRQTLAGYTNANKTHKLANKLMDLISCRESDKSPDKELQKWIDACADNIRDRLSQMDLIDAESAQEDRPLLIHLEGDDNTIGYVQALKSRGVTPEYFKPTIGRIKAVLTGCAFTYFSQLASAGACTTIEVWLGERRERGDINGSTFNKTVADLKRFARWLHDEGRTKTVALAKLKRVGNAEADAVQRRSLSPDEVMHLVNAAAASPKVHDGVTGDERANLWRFLFTTGIRPGQLRELKVSDFNLDADPPTVRAAARFVKKRKVHIQELRPVIVADLRRRFANKLPGTIAFRMPNKHRMADAFKADLTAARDAWIADAAGNPRELEARQRSDFLAIVNHAGETAVAYSLRHSFGTALAKAGATESTIAKAMHHSSRTTTVRYIHADQTEVGHAMSKLPELDYQSNVATGTDGPVSTEFSGLRTACAGSSDSVGFSGIAEHGSGAVALPEITGKVDNPSAIEETGDTSGCGEIGRRNGLKIR